MAAGDVDVTIVENPTATSLDTAITAMRTTANDKWMICPIHNGKAVIIVNIEEA